MDTPDPSSDYPPPSARPAGRAYVIAAFVLAGAAACTIIPIFTGPLGVVLAMVGRRKGDEVLGKRAVVAAIIGMAVGIVLNVILLGNDRG